MFSEGFCQSCFFSALLDEYTVDDWGLLFSLDFCLSWNCFIISGTDKSFMLLNNMNIMNQSNIVHELNQQINRNSIYKSVNRKTFGSFRQRSFCRGVLKWTNEKSILNYGMMCLYKNLNSFNQQILPPGYNPDFPS